MKPGAVLINTARGALVDEIALADAVRLGRIAGAALDVADIEPVPANSPLRGVAGIAVLPHLAGRTVETRRRIAIAAAEEVVAALAGAPRSSLNHHLIRRAPRPATAEGTTP